VNAQHSGGHGLGRPYQDPDRYRAWPDATTKEAEVFGGLSPRPHSGPDTPPCQVGNTPGGSQRSLLGSLPLIMTGTLTAGVAVTGAFPAVPAEPIQQANPSEHQSLQGMMAQVAERLNQALHPVSHSVVNAIAPHIPDTYTVKPGDTIDSIASSHGIPQAAVLGLNGLHMNSVLQEGQILKLTTAPTKQRASAPPRVALSHYVLQNGDTVAALATRFGISEEAIIQANNINRNATLIAGDVLRIPGTRQVTVPRAIPTIHAAQAQSRIVSAQLTSPQAADTRGQADTRPASQTSAPASTDSAEEVTDSAGVDPLMVDIAEAPKLRVVKPPPPPPPPPVAKAPEKKEPAPTRSPSSSSASSSQTSTRQPVSGRVTSLNDSQKGHARTVIAVGRELGVPDYGIVIALATAMQESSFRNITRAVDHDSLGLFQQRPYWWGTPEQLTDPAYASRAFYQGVRIDGRRSLGLLQISGWQNMDLTVAAQRVQRSAHPDAYAKWEASAWAWLSELG